METRNLIDSLVVDLKPVRSIKTSSGITVALVATFVAALGVIAVFGARTDILAGAPDPIVVIRCILLVLLGLATSFAVTAAARPSVGNGSNGWVWALAAAFAMPLAAILLYAYHMMTAQPFAKGDMDFSYGPHCLAISAASAVLIGTVQTLWLQRGAPTNPYRSGWLVGLASGSLGTFAYSLHCPSTSIYYIGLFYALAVGLCAIVGRLVVPRLIRW